MRAQAYVVRCRREFLKESWGKRLRNEALGSKKEPKHQNGWTEILAANLRHWPQDSDKFRDFLGVPGSRNNQCGFG
jgi:hypothetical protein